MPPSDALLATITERQWQATVEELLKLGGWRYYHTWTARHSVAGYPDITAVRGIRLIFAELKTETGKVATAQREWLDALRASGHAEAYLWRPRDREIVERILLP